MVKKETGLSGDHCLEGASFTECDDRATRCLSFECAQTEVFDAWRYERTAARVMVFKGFLTGSSEKRDVTAGTTLKGVSLTAIADDDERLSILVECIDYEIDASVWAKLRNEQIEVFFFVSVCELLRRDGRIYDSRVAVVA